MYYIICESEEYGDRKERINMDGFQHILGSVRRAVTDYDMIKNGDRIAVGLSGGKDSILLLTAISELHRFAGIDFGLCAITVDIGLSGMDFSPTEDFCRTLGVPYHTVKTDIAEIVFNVRHEKNPCSLCAKLRRGALHGEAKNQGCNKLALGHHNDDVVDTFMLNLVHEGRLGTFEPVTYLSRRDLYMIRPLIYVREHEVVSAVRDLRLPVVTSTCPADKNTEREEMRKLLTYIDRDYRGIRKRVFGAIERAGLDGWHENERGRKE